jgi:adhesin transport system membrane fusion protein
MSKIKKSRAFIDRLVTSLESNRQKPLDWNIPEQDLDYMSDTSSAVLQESPRGAKLLIIITIVFFAVALLWTLIAELDEITRGGGKVIPSSQIQIIQNLEGGIIEQLAVKEGDVVDAGQIIVKLNPTRFSASLQEDRLKYLALIAKSARLSAEADGDNFVAPEIVSKEQPELVAKEQKLFESRKQQHQRNVYLIQKELNMTRPLVKEGAISEVEVLRLERQINEIKGQFRNDARTELNEVNAEIKRLEESIIALKDRVDRTSVRSPVRGIVKQLMVSTVGGVIKPGMEIAEIVPLDDSLLVEAKIRPSDIAFLHPGLKAIVKITAYDYAIYGGLDAELEHISADTITDEEGESFYLVRVRTEKSYLGNEKDPLPIIPGMQASVDILTGKKSIFAYLMKPVLRAKERAMTER